MSARAVAHVWEASRQGGTPLLVLLAVAWHTDDMTGAATVARDDLARMARISERQMVRVVERLQDAGELAVERGSGRGHVSAYRLVGLAKGDTATAPIKGDTTSSPFSAERVTSGAIKGDISGRKGDIRGGTIGGGVVPSSQGTKVTKDEDTATHVAAAADAGGTLMARYELRYRTEANKQGVVGDLFSELLGRRANVGRLGGMGKRLGSGKRLMELIIDASKQFISDDPHDYLERMVQREVAGGDRSGPTNGRRPSNEYPGSDYFKRLAAQRDAERAGGR